MAVRARARAQPLPTFLGGGRRARAGALVGAPAPPLPPTPFKGEGAGLWPAGIAWAKKRGAQGEKKRTHACTSSPGSGGGGRRAARTPPRTKKNSPPPLSPTPLIFSPDRPPGRPGCRRRLGPPLRHGRRGVLRDRQERGRVGRLCQDGGHPLHPVRQALVLWRYQRGLPDQLRLVPRGRHPRVFLHPGQPGRPRRPGGRLPQRLRLQHVHQDAGAHPAESGRVQRTRPPAPGRHRRGGQGKRHSPDHDARQL